MNPVEASNLGPPVGSVEGSTESFLASPSPPSPLDSNIPQVWLDIDCLMKKMPKHMCENMGSIRSGVVAFLKGDKPVGYLVPHGVREFLQYLIHLRKENKLTIVAFSEGSKARDKQKVKEQLIGLFITLGITEPFENPALTIGIGSYEYLKKNAQKRGVQRIIFSDLPNTPCAEDMVFLFSRKLTNLETAYNTLITAQDPIFAKNIFASLNRLFYATAKIQEALVGSWPSQPLNDYEKGASLLGGSARLLTAKRFQAELRSMSVKSAFQEVSHPSSSPSFFKTLGEVISEQKEKRDQMKEIRKLHEKYNCVHP